MPETLVSYQGELRCRSVHAPSGTVVVTDAPTDHHGKGEGFSPSELLSLSLGSCILSIMGIAARAMGTDIAGATARVVKEMANNPRRIARSRSAFPAASTTISVPG